MPPKQTSQEKTAPNQYIKANSSLLQLFNDAEPTAKKKMNSFAYNSRTFAGSTIADLLGLHQHKGEWPKKTLEAIGHVKDPTYQQAVSSILKAAVSEENGGIYNFKLERSPKIPTSEYAVQLGELAQKLTDSEIQNSFVEKRPEIDPNQKVESLPVLSKAFLKGNPHAAIASNGFVTGVWREVEGSAADRLGLHQYKGEWSEKTAAEIGKLKTDHEQSGGRVMILAAAAEENAGIYDFKEEVPIEQRSSEHAARLASEGKATKLTPDEVRERFVVALPEVEPDKYIQVSPLLLAAYKKLPRDEKRGANVCVEKCWTGDGETLADLLGLHQPDGKWSPKTSGVISGLKTKGYPAGGLAMILAAASEENGGIYAFNAETPIEQQTSRRAVELNARKLTPEEVKKQFEAINNRTRNLPTDSNVEPAPKMPAVKKKSTRKTGETGKKRKASEIDSEEQVAASLRERSPRREVIEDASTPIVGADGMGGAFDRRMEPVSEFTLHDDRNFFNRLKETLNGYHDALKNSQSPHSYLATLKTYLQSQQKTLARILQGHGSENTGYFAENDSENLNALRKIAQFPDVLPKVAEHPPLHQILKMGNAQHKNEFSEGRLYLSPPRTQADMPERYFFQPSSPTEKRWSLPRFDIPKNMEEKAQKDSNGHSYIGTRMYAQGGIEIFDPALLAQTSSFAWMEKDGSQGYTALKHQATEFNLQLVGGVAILSLGDKNDAASGPSHEAGGMEIDPPASPRSTASQSHVGGRYSQAASEAMRAQASSSTASQDPDTIRR